MKSPLGKMRVVRIGDTARDPSLDWSMMLKEDLIGPYFRTRDEEHLRFLPGDTAEKPVYFHVTRLPAAFMTQVISNLYQKADQQTAAFNAACHLVTLADGLTPMSFNYGDPNEPVLLKVFPSNTQNVKGLDFVAKDGAFGVDVAPQEAWPQAITDCFGYETVCEIGQVAMDFARLRVGAKGPFALWGGSGQMR